MPTKNNKARLSFEQLLTQEYLELKNKIIKGEVGESSVLRDWNRALDRYFIEKKTIREIRRENLPEEKLVVLQDLYDELNKSASQEDEEKIRNIKDAIESFFTFKNIDDLSQFFEKHLLCKIEDKNSKKYYLTLLLYSFHQGGFPHLCAKLNAEFIASYCRKENILFSQPKIKIYFTPLQNDIRIKEQNSYNEVKNSLDEDDERTELKEEGYHFRTESSIKVSLAKSLVKGYNLKAIIELLNFDLHSDLSKELFKDCLKNLPAKKNLFSSFLGKIKAFWKKFFGEMDKNWQKKAEENGQIQSQNQPDPLPKVVLEHNGLANGLQANDTPTKLSLHNNDNKGQEGKEQETVSKTMTLNRRRF